MGPAGHLGWELDVCRPHLPPQGPSRCPHLCSEGGVPGVRAGQGDSEERMGRGRLADACWARVRAWCPCPPQQQLSYLHTRDVWLLSWGQLG